MLSALAPACATVEVDVILAGAAVPELGSSDLRSFVAPFANNSSVTLDSRPRNSKNCNGFSPSDTSRSPVLRKSVGLFWDSSGFRAAVWMVSQRAIESDMIMPTILLCMTADTIRPSRVVVDHTLDENKVSCCKTFRDSGNPHNITSPAIVGFLSTFTLFAKSNAYFGGLNVFVTGCTTIEINHGEVLVHKCSCFLDAGESKEPELTRLAWFE